MGLLRKFAGKIWRAPRLVVVVRAARVASGNFGAKQKIDELVRQLRPLAIHVKAALRRLLA